MHFTTDKQTLDDLNIFGKRGEGSVYSLFNHTRTRGGALLLEQLFNEPLSRPETIGRRISILRHLAAAGLEFPCQPEWLDAIEQYLANTDQRTKLSHEDAAISRRITGLVTQSTEQATIFRGIASTVELVHACREFLKHDDDSGVRMESRDAGTKSRNAWSEELSTIRQILADPSFELVLQLAPKKKLTLAQNTDLDELLRFRHRSVIRRLLDRIYSLDVYLTVARIASNRHLCFPTVLDAASHMIDIKGLYHPALKEPVSNTVRITRENNLIFLTGANMAGKSTFMKSFGIALYLAHMGFPVPAAEMTFSVLDGLITTINLPDNLGIGASHFYAEVLRVKQVAEELNRGKNLLVIFDELFRGTNVKDAYEATIAIVEAFAGRRNSIFVISTHIIEAGEVLKERCANIGFLFLPTRMNGKVPVYTYQLEPGITDDRHGMIIINNENILGILEKGKLQS